MIMVVAEGKLMDRSRAINRVKKKQDQNWSESQARDNKFQ